MLKRVKGHGKRTTYELRSFKGASGWHIKLRPRNETGELSNEARRINPGTPTNHPTSRKSFSEHKHAFRRAAVHENS